MKINMGSKDRLIRATVGITLIALSIFGLIGWWGWLGVIPLGTAAIRHCPVYPALGINTCERPPEE